MRKQNLLTASILIAVSGASTTAFAVPAITDYTEATSAYEDAFISGNFNADSGNQPETTFNLDATVDYEKVFSSPNRNTKLDLSASGSRKKGFFEVLDANGDPVVQNNKVLTELDTRSQYQALGSATVDNYFRPGSKAGFWFGKGEVGVKKGQVDPFTKATVGVGYGRVVNVTPMARSIRIIESLQEDGFLKGDPSNAIYQKVANIIDRENEYLSKHGAARYEQYWVQDIQAAIETSRLVNGQLNARAILRSYEVLTQERISTRKNGWLVRAGVGAVLTDFDGEDGKPALEVGAEYHRPLSNATQFSTEAIATATLKDGDNGFNFNNAMSLTHEISDTIDWENRWTLSHSESDVANDITTNTVSSAFFYSLTNQLDLGITATLTDLNDRVDNNGNDELDKSLVMGVKYRLK